MRRHFTKVPAALNPVQLRATDLQSSELSGGNMHPNDGK